MFINRNFTNVRIFYSFNTNMYYIGDFVEDAGPRGATIKDAGPRGATFAGNGIIVVNNRIITVGNWKRKIDNLDFTEGYNSVDYKYIRDIIRRYHISYIMGGGIV